MKTKMTKLTDRALNKVLSAFDGISMKPKHEYIKIPHLKDLTLLEFMDEFMLINELTNEESHILRDLFRQYQINTIKDKRLGHIIFEFMQKSA